jgi:hypothetical protein
VRRHAKVDDRRQRVIRRSAIAFVWLCGLGAGFTALLAATARYGCAADDSGMACRPSGSALGIVLAVTVIAVVVAVGVLTAGQPARRVFVVGGAGVAAFAVCFVAARSLLATA